MILTITLNPSVDISYQLDHFSIDKENRVSDVSKTAGGKGLNVSRVLRQLQEEVAATGFLGGTLGHFIRTQVSALGIRDFFVKTNGDTRNCIAVIHEGKQTEILESGPSISEPEANEFMETFKEYLQKVDLVTISGSLPKGLPDDFYEKLIAIAEEQNKRVLLDTKGELLKHSLLSDHKPYLIKPNQVELADLLGKTIDEDMQIIEALKSPMFSDIPWVVVTLGAAGALVKHDNSYYRVQAPHVDAKNPVGSGDSVIAGFAAGLHRGMTGKELIKFGLAMGVLNAMEEKTGHIDVAKVEWCTEQTNVEEIR